MLGLSDTSFGYLSVALSILFFGSFAVPLKLKRVQEVNLDPVVFQIYYSIAVFISSWLVLIYNPFVFTPFGIAGAAFWVPSSILSIFAIQFLGMSVAVGTWAGVTILVSFAWGSLVFHTPVNSIGLSILALFLLMLGIFGLSLSNTDFIKNLGKKKEEKTKSENFEEDPKQRLINENKEEAQKTPDQDQTNSSRTKLLGLGCAIFLGVLNGSMLVPTKFTPPEASGIVYIVSFGIGVMMVTPVCAIVYFLIKRQLPVFHLRATLLPGLLTGFLWNIGNFFSIYATKYLGLTIGFPLTQLALVVSGLYGIILFKEMTGFRTIFFWSISVVVLLVGAALLSLFG